MRAAGRLPRICLVSSSGGHWEQLRRLQPLAEKYPCFYVTEHTRFPVPAGTYQLLQTDRKDRLMPLKMAANSLWALCIWIRKRPDLIITTGTMAAYPFYLLAILFRKKFIFIETFARASLPTVAGLKMQRHADLFFVQWESQKRFYKNAIYRGCLY